MNKNLEAGKEDIVRNYTRRSHYSETAEREEQKKWSAQIDLDHVIQKLADENLISLEDSRKLKAGSAYLRATDIYFHRLARNGESARKSLGDESKKVYKSEKKTIKTYLKEKKAAEKRLEQRKKHIAKEFKFKKSYGCTVEHSLFLAAKKYNEILEAVSSFLGSYRARDLYGDEKDDAILGYLARRIEVKKNKVVL